MSMPVIKRKKKYNDPYGSLESRYLSVHRHHEARRDFFYEKGKMD
jgi:hypothetical protein